MDGSPRMIRNHKSWDREKVDRDQQCFERIRDQVGPFLRDQ